MKNPGEPPRKTPSTENPYRPPAAPLRDPLPPPGSPTLAVLAGVGVYLGGMAASGAIIAGLTVTLGMQGGTFQELNPGTPVFNFVGVVDGAVFSLLGAYVCARMARANERRVTVIMVSVSTAARLALALTAAWMLQRSVAPSGWGAAALVAAILCAIAGGELGRRRNLADAHRAGAATAV